MLKKEPAFSTAHVVFIVATLFCLAPPVSAGIALMLGIIISLTFGNPYADFTRKMTHRLLQISIIGLGAGMNLTVIGRVGLQGVGYTIVGILFTILFGMILGKLLKTDDNTSLLLSVGTAICGGSAIAAIASTIQAKSHEVSVALATVFFLNASALFIFPGIGHHFGLTEIQFGLWSALAIHDTSSVVGAAIQYGAKAVEIATTVKLARALWIIPVSICVGLFWNRKNKENPTSAAKRPWFILGFLIAAAIVTWIPALEPAGLWVSAIAKRTLVLTLFFIGSGLTRATIKNVGIKPFAQGFCLWIIMGTATLGAVLANWIHE